MPKRLWTRDEMILTLALYFSAAIRAVEPYHARGQRVGQADEQDRKPCYPGSNEFCLLR